MNTLLLDATTWDLTLDASGNIAMATLPYAMAQDVASAVRLFRGELYYNPGIGVAWSPEIFGAAPPLGFVRAQVEANARRVPGVVSAQAFFSSIDGRRLTGQVLVRDAAGEAQIVGF